MSASAWRTRCGGTPCLPAGIPPGRFAANSAWALCTTMTHNLLRATATLTSRAHALARGATLRRQLINVPARLVRPPRRPVLRFAHALAPRPTMTEPVEQHLPRHTCPTGRHLTCPTRPTARANLPAAATRYADAL